MYSASKYRQVLHKVGDNLLWRQWENLCYRLAPMLWNCLGTAGHNHLDLVILVRKTLDFGQRTWIVVVTYLIEAVQTNNHSFWQGP